MASISITGGTVFIDLSGDKELLASLKSFPTRVESKIVRQAVNAANRTIFQSIVAETPVAPGPINKGGYFVQQPGFLRSKIREMPTKYRKRGRTQRLTILPRRADLLISESDPYYWPSALMFGHRLPYQTRGLKKQNKNIKHAPNAKRAVAPRPFVTQGFDAVATSAAAQLVSMIERGIEREAAKR